MKLKLFTIILGLFLSKPLMAQWYQEVTFNVRDTWMDVATATSSIRSVLLSSDTLKSGATAWVAIQNAYFTQPVEPRNIQIAFYYHAFANGDYISSSVTVTGINQFGNVVSEVIISTLNSTTEGSVIFSTITSISWGKVYASGGAVGNTGALKTNLYWEIGQGNKLGLTNDILIVTDVYKIIEAGANVNSNGTLINATYNSYTPVSAPNASRDYVVYYKARKRQ